MSDLNATRTFWKDVVPRNRKARGYTLRMLGLAAAFAAFALLVTALDRLHDFRAGLPVGPYEVGGAALGLLLILRTNSAYDRWWEARIQWGLIGDRARAIATAALAYGPDEPGWRARVLRLTAAFVHAARREVRGDGAYPELPRLLGAVGVDLTYRPNPTLAVAGELAAAFRRGNEKAVFPAGTINQMERCRVEMLGAHGSCLRIQSTPLPQAYAIALRQLLFAYLITFPLAIQERAGWFTPLIVLFVAYPLVVLDRIAAELQNPFPVTNLNHLPLDELCDAIEADVMGLDRPRPAPPADATPPDGVKPMKAGP